MVNLLGAFVPYFLAFDIGTSGGRTMLAHLSDDGISLQILTRFPNQAVMVRGTLYWDILNLWQGVLQGLDAWQRTSMTIDAIGLDTWSVDFALLDDADHLLDNPVSNRDSRTNGMPDKVFAVIPRAELYHRTGIQMMQINTLYQLYALKQADDPSLANAKTFLTVADLLNFWLTGQQVVEYTSATCTQFYNAHTAQWDVELLNALRLPTAMLPEVVQPGTVLGPLTVMDHDPVPVVAVGTHDTASAVAAVPTDGKRHFAYISSGTWSLMGVELDSPLISDDACNLNFTNEGGVAGTIRFLKNILGMWLVQACQAQWSIEGDPISHEKAVQLARQSPVFGPLIDPYPDNPYLREPGDMPTRIRDYCRASGQEIPADKGAILRCIFESLALKYRQVLGELEQIQQRDIEVIHIVGGGSRNGLLCQMTADATARPVIAGPAEATALGNVIVQAMATGHIVSLAEGRAIVRRSSDLRHYEPHPSAAWDAAYDRFCGLAL